MSSPVAAVQAELVSAVYGPQAVIYDVDIAVYPGEVVGLLGANGAGKTTTLLTLAGELPPLAGRVLIDGASTTAPLYRRARAGLAFVPAEKSVFMGLTARDNLRVAEADIDAALELFPELEKRLGVRAGLLSGGEQQMLTLARALSRKPRVLLADELSMGLAPLVVKRLLGAVVRAAQQMGTAVLLVEQHVRKALEHCDRAYVMHRGHVALSGASGDLLEQITEIENHYLTTATVTS
jgi:branched-chain amino acid transport system ATP-binding protein